MKFESGKYYWHEQGGIYLYVAGSLRLEGLSDMLIGEVYMPKSPMLLKAVHGSEEATHGWKEIDRKGFLAGKNAIEDDIAEAQRKFVETVDKAKKLDRREKIIRLFDGKGRLLRGRPL